MKLKSAAFLFLASTALLAASTIEGAIVATPATVAPGATITVTVTGGPANPRDWVGLHLASAADTSLVDWFYLNGSRTAPTTGMGSATLTFTAPSSAGTYNLRFFQNNTFTKLGTSGNVTVQTGGTPSLTAGPASVNPGQNITVTVANGPGNPADWVALHPTAAADTTYVDWKYLNGTRTQPASGLTAATLTFPAPTTPGTYNLRFFRNNGFTKLATSGTVTVASAGVPQLTVSATSVAPGQTVQVSVANGPGNPADWISLNASAGADSGLFDWKYLNGTRTAPALGSTTATVSFPMPSAPGTYNFRLFRNNTYEKVATSVTVTVNAAPALSVNLTSVNPGQNVTVTLANGPGNPTDWVGLHLTTAADSTFVDWKYLNGSRTAPTSGLRSATLTFPMPSAPGTYNFRLFKTSPATRLATSVTVTVRSTATPVLTVSPPSVAPGQAVQVTLASGPGNRTDWIGLHTSTGADTGLLDWKYLNGTRTAPAQGVTAATVSFTMPLSAGAYNFRLFSNGGYTKIATSPTVTVQGGLPALSAGDASVAEGNSGTTNLVFPVTLSFPSTQAVTVAYATANGTASSASDYTATSGTLTFPSGTTSRTVTVLVRGDTSVEPNETLRLNLSNPTGASIARAQGVGTITNDDQGPPATPTLVLPSGAITDPTPEFRWNVASGAAEYVLRVARLSGALDFEQVVPASACTSTLCSFTSVADLGSGTHRFWVQAKNSVGDSPFSAPLTFEISLAGGTVVTVTSHSSGQTVSTQGFVLSGTAISALGVAALRATVDDPVLGRTIDNRVVQVASTGRFALWVKGGQVSAGQLVAVSLSATLADSSISTTQLNLQAENPDPRIEQLLNRITFGATPGLLTEVRALGADAFVEEQLNPATIDDSAAEAVVGAMPRTTKAQLQAATLMRGIRSRRQLQEVLTKFWDNHFNTDINKSAVVAYEVAENDLFRQNALGFFRDLLEISATSPAMLIYLDNAESLKIEPNENYSRELMELHTLGVNGGYTQNDVVQVAKAFTGWTVTAGAFAFDATNHDTTQKLVLGQTIPAGGDISDGRRVLDILAAHPSTARFICTKLARLLVSDQPSSTLVDNCASTFASTQGHIGSVVRELLTSADFAAPENFRVKVKDPYELELGLIRALNASTLATDLVGPMREMGLVPFENPVPTGWSETGDDWVSSNTLLQRLRWVNQVANATSGGSATSVDPRTYFPANGYETTEGITGFLFDLVFQGESGNEEPLVAVDILDAGGASPFSLTATDADARLRRFLGTVLSYPNYQVQ